MTMTTPGGLAAGLPLSRGLVEALLTRRGVVAYWLVAATLFALGRYVASPTLSLDEARSVEMAQELAAGYTARQPPLYDQLSWLVAKVLGPGAASQLTLRFGLIALIGWFAFLAGERATGSERLGAAASLLLSLHSYFGWSFHHWGTHTLVLCATTLASFVTLIDLARWPGSGRAVLFGLAMGLGLTSKFSFPLFLGGLLAAGLTLPEVRQVLRSRWMLVAALVATALCAPYLLWLSAIQGDMVGAVRAHMIPGTQSHLARAAVGPGRLAWSLFEFMAPWIAAVALLMPRALDPRISRERPASPAERLAQRTTAAGIALAAAGIVASGATTVNDHYMPPLLALAPVLLVARAGAIERSAAKLPRIAWAALAAMIVVALCRAALPTVEALRGRAPGTGHLPYEALARELSARGYARGTALTPEVREAGNLRAVLPELRVLATGNSHRALRPLHRDGSRERCFAVWALPAGPPDDSPTASVPTLPQGVKAATIEATIIRVGSVRWAVLDLQPDSPGCQ